MWESQIEESFAKVEKRATLKKASSSRVEVATSEVEEVLEGVQVEEFGPGEAPLRELATIDLMLKKGISVEEVCSI